MIKNVFYAMLTHYSALNIIINYNKIECYVIYKKLKEI